MTHNGQTSSETVHSALIKTSRSGNRTVRKLGPTNDRKAERIGAAGPRLRGPPAGLTARRECHAPARAQEKRRAAAYGQLARSRAANTNSQSCQHPAGRKPRPWAISSSSRGTTPKLTTAQKITNPLETATLPGRNVR